MSVKYSFHHSAGLNVSQEGTGCLVADQGGSDKVAQF